MLKAPIPAYGELRSIRQAYGKGCIGLSTAYTHKSVLKYFNPESQRITAIALPLKDVRSKCKAAATLAPARVFLQWLQLTKQVVCSVASWMGLLQNQKAGRLRIVLPAFSSIAVEKQSRLARARFHWVHHVRWLPMKGYPHDQSWMFQVMSVRYGLIL